MYVAGADLIVGVEQGEDIPFAHGNLARGFLSVVVQGHDAFLPNHIRHWRLLL